MRLKIRFIIILLPGYTNHEQSVEISRPGQRHKCENNLPDTWKVLPARAGIAIRRVKWWQAMKEHNHAHLQTKSAIWGQLLGEAQPLTAEGSLSPKARPFVVAFSEGLRLFVGLSGTEDFFELWEKKHLSVVSFFR